MFAQYGFALKGLVQHFRVHIFGIHLSQSRQMAKGKGNFQTLGINPVRALLLDEILMGYDYSMFCYYMFCQLFWKNAAVNGIDAHNLDGY